MRKTRNIIAWLAVLALIGGGIYLYTRPAEKKEIKNPLENFEFDKEVEDIDEFLKVVPERGKG